MSLVIHFLPLKTKNVGDVYTHVHTCKIQLAKSASPECLEVVGKSPLSPFCSEWDPAVLQQLFQAWASSC